MEVEDNTHKCMMIQTSPSRNRQLVVNDVVYRSAYDLQLSEEELMKASKELNETENQKKDCIRNLREKLAKDKEFQYRTDDNYLLCYLRYRKFDCIRAYDTIRRSHAMKVKFPELFALPSNLESLLNRGFISCLPYRDDQGRTIVTVNFGKWNLEEMTFEEMMQCSNALLDVVTMDPHSQINGTVGLWDFKGLTAKHVAEILRPSLVWSLANLVQDTNPNRIKLGLFVNCHKLMRAAYGSVQFFMKKKMVDRIKLFGSDVTEIHKYLNPALLPEEYGGTLRESECNATQHIMDNLCYLKYSRSFTATPDNSLD